MIIRINCICLAIMVFLFPTLLQAQNLDLAEADFFEDAPLVLTASRMSKPLNEAPASVSVIDREMIENSGARELADIFRLVPGFIVGNHNGNTPVVTYQGLGGEFLRQIQVLVDGRSVFVPTWGGVPWNNLPLLMEDIERVEVIRGPNAVTYGANAFLATINIITRQAAEDIGVRYSLTTSGGSAPEVGDAYFRLGYQFEKIDWRLSVGSLNDDGFESVNDSRETNKLNYRLDYQASNNSLWTILLGTSNTIGGDGVSDDPIDPDRDQETNNSYLNISWEQVNDDSSTSVRLTHTVQEFIDGYWLEPNPDNLVAFIDFGRLSRRTDLEIFQTMEFSDSFRLVYGGSIRRDRLNSVFLFSDQAYHEVETSRLHTAIEWRPDQDWLLDFGTAAEDSSITELEYSPRLSILRKLGDSHTARFIISEAKRNPVLFEHSGSTILNISVPSIPATADVELWRGNPDAQPEEIVSYEIGLHSQIIDTRLTSDLKLFSYDITGLLDPERVEYIPLLDDYVQTFENKHDVQVEGLELALNYSPLANLDFYSGFSIIDADSQSRDMEASFPDYSAFLTAYYRWQRRHSLSVSYYYIDKMEWIDQTEDDNIGDTEKLDLRYAYLLDATSETRFEIIGHNLTGSYQDYFPENINERVYLFRISGGF